MKDLAEISDERINEIAIKLVKNILNHKLTEDIDEKSFMNALYKLARETDVPIKELETFVMIIGISICADSLDKCIGVTSQVIKRTEGPLAKLEQNSNS